MKQEKATSSRFKDLSGKFAQKGKFHQWITVFTSIGIDWRIFSQFMIQQKINNGIKLNQIKVTSKVYHQFK